MFPPIKAGAITPTMQSVMGIRRHGVQAIPNNTVTLFAPSGDITSRMATWVSNMASADLEANRIYWKVVPAGEDPPTLSATEHHGFVPAVQPDPYQIPVGLDVDIYFFQASGAPLNLTYFEA